MKRYDVVIIGGGITGCSLVRDLKIRGFKVALLERNRHICSKTSLNNHRTLLSGVRYVVNDLKVAEQCWKEHNILKSIAPDAIAKIRNFYVVLDKEKDIAYSERAVKNAKRLGIPMDEVPLKNAFDQSPCLNKERICKVYETPDRSMIYVVKYCQKCIENIDNLYHSCKEIDFSLNNGRIEKLKVNGKDLYADFFINATGPWANTMLQKVDLNVPMIYSQGSILILKARSPINIHVLRIPQDGDAYMTYGPIALLGTTSINIKGPDKLQDEPLLEKRMKDCIKEAVPEVVNDKVLKIIRGVRPLISNGNKEGRQVSRSYYLLDHEKDGIDNFVTITGGKLTLARLMAEKTVDLICKKAGNKAKCETHIRKL